MELLDYLTEHYSSTAVRGHYSNIQRYITYMNGKAPTAQYLQILSYISMLRKQNLHPKTIRIHLFCVKMYYHYLQQSGQRPDHPCRNLLLKDQINRAIPLETLYSEEQLQTLMLHYQALDGRLQLRNQAVLSLLVYQALTVSEIALLQLQDINLEKGLIHIKESVQLRGRTLPLKPNQILLFYHYIHQDRERLTLYYKRDSGYLILSKYAHPISTNIIRRILYDKTHPQGEYTPIKIRQSVIYHLLKKNNTRVVQVFAGHRSSSATQAYKQSGLEELKDDINKLHPLQLKEPTSQPCR